MALELLVVRAAFILGAGIALGVAWYAWQNRPKPGTRPLTAMMLSTALWLIAFTLGSLSGFELAVVWLKVTFLGVSGVVVSLFVFALEYTGRSELVTKRVVGLLLLEPLYVQAVVWTNESHWLFWTVLEPTTANILGVARTPWGPAYWLHSSVSYVLIAVSVYLVVRFALKSDTLYRAQSGAILVGIFAPWISNALFIIGPSPVDLTPIGFVVTGVTLGYAMFRYQLMDVTPVARNTVVDTLNAGVFVVDEDRRFVDVNQSGADLLGSEQDELIGNRVTDALADVPEISERFQSYADATAEAEFELEYGNFHFRVQVSPLEADGDQIGQVFLVHDITDQKHRQRELERQNEQLDQFASVVSHDLRNPLNVAESRVELLEAKGDEIDNLEDHLADVDEAHDRMEQLIDDVLALARDGKTIDETEQIDLGMAATDAWDHVDTADGRLVVDSSNRIRADSDRLRRVFENLFRNAMEHAATDGAPTVRVGAIETGNTDDGLEPPGFYVADDGPGIPEDERETVFEAGESGAGSSGLGLSIVQNIVEAHGWTVDVTDSEDGGARFEIRHVETVDESDQRGPWVTTTPEEPSNDRVISNDPDI